MAARAHIAPSSVSYEAPDTFKIRYIPVVAKRSENADGCRPKFDFDRPGTFHKVIRPQLETPRPDRTYLQYSVTTNTLRKQRVPGKRRPKESLDFFTRQQARMKDAKSFDSIHHQLLRDDPRTFYTTRGPLAEFSEAALKNKDLHVMQIGAVRTRVNPRIKRSHTAWEPAGIPHNKSNPFQKPFKDKRREMQKTSMWMQRAEAQKDVSDGIAEWENQNHDLVDWRVQTKDELNDAALRQEEKIRQENEKKNSSFADNESVTSDSMMDSQQLHDELVLQDEEEQPVVEESETDRKKRELIQKDKEKPPPPMKKKDYLEKVHSLFASHIAPCLKTSIKVDGEYFIATVSRAAVRTIEEFTQPKALPTGADNARGGVRIKVHGVESCEDFVLVLSPKDLAVNQIDPPPEDDDFGDTWKAWLKKLVPRLAVVSAEGVRRNEQAAEAAEDSIYSSHTSSAKQIVEKDIWRLAIVPPAVASKDVGSVPPKFDLSSSKETELSRVLRAAHGNGAGKKKKRGAAKAQRRVSAAWRTPKARGAITAWGKKDAGIEVLTNGTVLTPHRQRVTDFFNL